MKSFSFGQNSIAKRIFAGLLALWMSGFVFLFCCGSSNAQTSEKDTCPLAQKDCCPESEKKADAEQFEKILANDNAFDCCAFLPQLLNKTGKAKSNRQFAGIPLKQRVTGFSFVEIKSRQNNFTAYRSHQPDRSQTYLKNRLLRI